VETINKSLLLTRCYVVSIESLSVKVEVSAISFTIPRSCMLFPSCQENCQSLSHLYYHCWLLMRMPRKLCL